MRLEVTQAVVDLEILCTLLSLCLQLTDYAFSVVRSPSKYKTLFKWPKTQKNCLNQCRTH